MVASESDLRNGVRIVQQGRPSCSAETPFTGQCGKCNCVFTVARHLAHWPIFPLFRNNKPPYFACPWCQAWVDLMAVPEGHALTVPPQMPTFPPPIVYTKGSEPKR